MGKDRRGALRKLVVMVHSPEEFAFVSVKGRLRWDELNRVIHKYHNKEGGKKAPKMPGIFKVPTKSVVNDGL
jgi:hypothetical protein